MTTPLRAGIIGTGFMGAVHAEAVRAAGHTVVGFAGSHPDKAHIMANKNGGVGFASAEALFASDDVDIVHVCTPNHLHRDHAMPALYAGKHVVCEKPLATTAQEGEARHRGARPARHGKAAASAACHHQAPERAQARRAKAAGHPARRATHSAASTAGRARPSNTVPLIRH